MGKSEVNFVHERLMTAGVLPILVLAAGLFSPLTAAAGDFQITPMSLDLTRNAKSGTITIANEARGRLNLQLSVKQWSQDRDGKDLSADTEDIVYFPRIMTVEAGEQRIIRVGMKGAPGARERTYRLILEEMASRDDDAKGKKKAGVAIVMRVSLPIFVKPLDVQERASIRNVAMAKGVLTATVANEGAVHIRPQSVKAVGRASDGTVLVKKEEAGWYVLPGVTRTYVFTLPAEVCPHLATVEIEAATESIALSGSLNVRKEMCAP